MTWILYYMHATAHTLFLAESAMMIGELALGILEICCVLLLVHTS